jgi:hypothetical protein
MLGSYTFVEGAGLSELILKVTDEFWRRLPYDLDEDRRPNSVHSVVIDEFEGLSVAERLAVLEDLMVGNADLVIARRADEVFVHADVARTYLTDLVCEVVRQVLLRNDAIRDEDARRVAMAAGSLDELEERDED